MPRAIAQAEADVVAASPFPLLHMHYALKGAHPLAANDMPLGRISVIGLGVEPGQFDIPPGTIRAYV
jgi:hypothetical protein